MVLIYSRVCLTCSIWGSSFRKQLQVMSQQQGLDRRLGTFAMLSSASVERPQSEIEQRKSPFGCEKARVLNLFEKFEENVTHPSSSVATETSVAEVRTTLGTECWLGVRKKERMSACLLFFRRSSMATSRYFLKASPLSRVISGKRGHPHRLQRQLIPPVSFTSTGSAPFPRG